MTEVRSEHASALLSRKGVAKKLGASPSTVDRLRKRGLLRERRIGGLVRFAEEDVADLINASARVETIP